MNKLKQSLKKQLDFALNKLATADNLMEEEAWHGYVQGLKFSILQIEIINETAAANNFKPVSTKHL